MRWHTLCLVAATALLRPHSVTAQAAVQSPMEPVVRVSDDAELRSAGYSGAATIVLTSHMALEAAWDIPNTVRAIVVCPVKHLAHLQCSVPAPPEATSSLFLPTCEGIPRARVCRASARGLRHRLST